MNSYSVGVALWIFLAVAAVAGIVGDYKKRKLSLEPLRMAIERGQQLDPKVVERLMMLERDARKIDPKQFELGGIITLATGVGIMIAAFFISQVAPKALFPMLGMGTIPICLGIGVIAAARVLIARNSQNGPHE